jgi:hypothetical protein
MTFPLYVLSKGRVETASTCVLLDQGNISYFLLTTPEEASLYAERYAGNLLALQQEGMKIGQVRNCVLEHAATHGYEWIWMLDDDLVEFFADGQATARSFFEHLETSIVQQPDIVMAGLCDRQTMLMGKGCKRDTSCYHMVAFQMQEMQDLRYREDLHFFTDTDFIVRIFLSGKHNARVLSCGYRTAVVGKNQGGLYETYRTRDRLADALRLISEYGVDMITLLPPPKRRPGWVRLNVAWDHAVEKGKKHAASARL